MSDYPAALTEEQEEQRRAELEERRAMEKLAHQAEPVTRFQDWMDKRMKLIEGDWDEVIIITGDERAGKSTLAFQMALYMDPDFQPKTHTHFTQGAYTRASARLPKRSTLILDEAIQGGFSRQASSPDNVALAKYLTVSGERNQIHLILWPNIKWLDPILKYHRARWNIHVKQRFRDHAVAEVRQLKFGEFIFDPPRPVFPFQYPKATGTLWQEYREAKSRFVQNVGRGVDDGDVRAQEDFLDKARTRLGPFARVVDAEAS